MITYLCEDTPEGIFTAVYDAWAAKIPDDRLHLMTEQEMNFSLFTEYRQVETDQEKQSRWHVPSGRRSQMRHIYRCIMHPCQTKKTRWMQSTIF